MNYVNRKGRSEKRVRFGGRGYYSVPYERPVYEYPVIPDFGGTTTHPAVAVGLGLGRAAFRLGGAIGRYGYNRFYGQGGYIDSSQYISKGSITRSQHGDERTRAQRMYQRGAFVKGALGEAYADYDPSWNYRNVPKTIDGIIRLETRQFGVQDYPCDIKVDDTDVPYNREHLIRNKLGNNQKMILKNGPLAVIIHYSHPDIQRSDLWVLNEHMHPQKSFNYLNSVGALRGIDRDISPLQGTPFSPGARAQLYEGITPQKL